MKTIQEIRRESRMGTTTAEMKFWQSVFISEAAKFIAKENHPDLAIKLMDQLEETQRRQNAELKAELV